MHYAVEYPVKGRPRHRRPGEGLARRLLRDRLLDQPALGREIRSLPKHPITRGVKPFTIRDEWYYNMRWIDDMKGVTPILQAAAAGQHAQHRRTRRCRKGEIETMAWAFERQGRRPQLRLHRRPLPPQLGRRELPPPGGERDPLVREGGRFPRAARRWTFDPADLNKNLDWKGKGKPTPRGSSRSCRRTGSSSRFRAGSS